MKTTYSFLLPITLACLALVSCASLTGVEFYVSPDGDDTQSGTRGEPFATLERARSAVRELRRSTGDLPPGGVTVLLRGGIHHRQAAFILEAQDSGSEGAPVIFASAPGETATLFGGTMLKREWFSPVTDASVLERLISPEARPRLLQCDLRGHGIAELGERCRRGFRIKADQPAPAMLYVSGRRMTLARWPNPDQHFPELLWSADRHRKGVVARSAIVDPGPGIDDPDFPTRGGTFTCPFDRPARWVKAEEVWLDGVFAWSWEWSYNRVAKIDPSTNQITLRYGEVSRISDQYSGNFFFAENLLEEIDQPGEYTIDRTLGRLYLLPDAAFHQGAAIHLSTLGETMVQVKNASDVTLRNLRFDTGRANALSLAGKRLRVERCEIANFAGTACTVHGEDCVVSACHVHDVGMAGISISGGNSKTLTAGNNRVEDCDIHDWAWFHRVYTPGAALNGVGQTLAHNRFHHCPHGALLLYGNDHLVACNQFSHVCQEFIDLGAIYINAGERPLERGWVFRHNYFHDIAATAESPINVEAIYLDHGTQGGLIEGNVFHRIGHVSRPWAANAIKNTGGLYTIARHNVFVDCTTAWKSGTYDCPAGYIAKRYQDYDYAAYFKGFDLARAPQVKKYPELAPFLPGAPPATPDQFWHRFEGNVLWNPTVPRYRPDGICVDHRKGQDPQVDPLIARDNWLASEDPGFVDFRAGNLTLRADAPVFRHIPGFPAIPFGEIGPRSYPQTAP